MKKTDIAMIILIVSVSVIISFFVARSYFGDLNNETTKVKTIEKIESAVAEPDQEVFNENAINPAVKVQITGSESTSKTTGTQ